MAIQEIYRVQIFYEGNEEKVQGAYDRLFLTNDPDVIAQEMFLGCPAAGPYMTVECTSWSTAKQMHEILTKLVRRAGSNLIA